MAQPPSPAEIVRTYGTASNFAATYNVGLEYACAQNVQRCFCGTAPRIRDLVTAFSEKEVMAWIMPHLVKIYKFAGVKEKPDGFMLTEMCRIILAEYSYLNAAELLLFFFRFSAGKYGTFYGAVDMMKVVAGLEEFNKYRREKLYRYDQERKAIELEAQRKEWDEKAEPMPKNLKYVRSLFAANGITVIPIADDPEDATYEEIK